MFPADEPQPEGSDRSIDNKKLKTDLPASEPSLAMALQYVAEDGRGKDYDGHPSVAHRSLAGQPEAEHAQQWAVCIGGQVVNGIDGTIIVQFVENDDNRHHQ